MSVDPARYRQTLLDAVTDDGLEELTLRLALPEYPRAYRTGRGSDGGVDVLSDLDRPPERAWQCKNGRPDWDDCRASLRAAMSDAHPPPHYTFVFPRPLTQRQLAWWRGRFVSEQRALYPQLDTLDLWDGLADRLADRPDLINRLNEGALASSYSAVAQAASQTGVNPLASIPDLVGDAPELARRAVEMGRSDPRYRYESRERETRAGDLTIPESHMRFGLDAPIGHPRSFTATIRSGNAVQEKAAEPREDVRLEQVTLWFADTPAAAAERDHVRCELAAGRAVDITCSADVALDARPLPNRFATLADPDGLVRDGEAHLGLSEPLTLEISMDAHGERSLTAEILLYRIPSDPGFSVSYGGTFHGALLFLDFNPDAQRPDGEAGNWTNVSVAVAIDADGVPATELLTGLGFIVAFGHANRLQLACADLLPAEGTEYDIGDPGADDATLATLEHAATVTTVLAALTRFDGTPRRLSPTGSERDLHIAALVDALLRQREIRQPLTRAYHFSVPGDVATTDPAELMRGVRRPLGLLSGQPTVVAELRIEGDANGQLLHIDGKTVVEARPRDGGHAEVVMALVGPVPSG